MAPVKIVYPGEEPMKFQSTSNGTKSPYGLTRSNKDGRPTNWAGTTLIMP